jgi:hypothetical protein
LLSRSKAIALFLITAAIVAVIAICLPPTPQPLSYHHFADQRAWLGIPNFGDVASNLAFAIVGMWGLIFLLRLSPQELPEHFVDARERWPYILVFTGMLLTAFGSSYYHLAPDNARLVWDRLPMTIVFMSMVAAIIMERISSQPDCGYGPYYWQSAREASCSGISAKSADMVICASTGQSKLIQQQCCFSHF